jgi:hypothetical protein
MTGHTVGRFVMQVRHSRGYAALRQAVAVFAEVRNSCALRAVGQCAQPRAVARRASVLQCVSPHAGRLRSFMHCAAQRGRAAAHLLKFLQSGHVPAPPPTRSCDTRYASCFRTTRSVRSSLQSAHFTRISQAFRMRFVRVSYDIGAPFFPYVHIAETPCNIANSAAQA